MSKEVPIEEIPEVIEYLDAKTNLEEFHARHAKLMAEYAALCEQYNTSLEAADKAVRQQKVNCGPFKQLTPQVKIHADKLYNAIGREGFVKAGGVIGSKATYEIDKKAFDSAVARNLIPEEIIPTVKEVTPKYSVIPKAVLP